MSGESRKNLSKETGISKSNIHKWKQQYLAEGEHSLENKKKPGNHLSRFARRKELSREEELEYQVETLKREILKKDSEITRLKKSPSNWKGGGTRKR